MSEQLALLPARLAAHLELALAALAIAAVVGVPLGVAVTRRRALEAPVLGFASAIQTIPSLALLAIMVPLLAALGAWTARVLGVPLSSIGYAPALLALTLYSLLPILRNTVAGIRAVDPALREAALGVGMTPRQQLLRVELPLALPVVVAGLRTAAVFAVGTATLSTPVGATSLGDFIFSGLQTRNAAAVLVGCVAAAALALLLDGTIGALERGLRERRRGLAAAALAALLAVGAGTAGAAVWQRAGGGERPLRIGAKPFTEQYVLAELLALWCEQRAGVRAETLESLGSTVAFDALRAGEIDVYVEYTGTVWATLMKRAGAPARREQVLEQVTDWLADEHRVVVAGALGFENTYALGMRAADARERGIRRIGQLARVAPALEIGGDFEFFARAEWTALRRAYGLRFRAERTMDPSLMYQALAAGEVDVISAYSTDGRLAAEEVTLLEDERGVIPPYDAIVLASPALAREQPRVLEALRALS
ncbi:MAG TPA: ABC transporter permease/substrate-binding protein, partial [Myxococcota bacterium]|nr:ABC transporter permease/substrate-binding protein [Myxococcota bacterium]